VSAVEEFMSAPWQVSEYVRVFVVGRNDALEYETVVTHRNDLERQVREVRRLYPDDHYRIETRIA
jgi:hypothetical protein